MRPSRGRSAALHLIGQLSEFSMRLPQGGPDAHQDDATHALKRLLHVTRPGSLVYLISDFRNLSAQMESTLNRLRRHSEVVLIHISDPLESDLPQAGRYQVTDGQKEAEINASNHAQRSHYHQRFEILQHDLRSMCRKNHVRYLSIRTDQPLLATLSQQTASSLQGVAP
jgi:uncharacterized protein (DUF58 family)